MSIRACVIIPVYNHADGIGPTLDAVLPSGLPVLLVDDGSEPHCAEVLAQLVPEPVGVEVAR